MLLGSYYASQGLAGAPTIVLGTEDSNRYVQQAGGRVVGSDDELAEVVVVADDDGYELLETVNQVVTVLLKRLDRGQRTHLLLPNPDLLFPRAEGAYGITSGAIAALIESVLRLRDPQGGLRFVPLGKPHRPMFEAAVQLDPAVDRRRIVMVGDQNRDRHPRRRRVRPGLRLRRDRNRPPRRRCRSRGQPPPGCSESLD